jgi:hypothetical protein
MWYNCRFFIGMEGNTYPELGIFPRYGHIFYGTWSLLVYMAASWHGFPSCRCSAISKYTCKYFCISLVLNLHKFGIFLMIAYSATFVY